MKSRLCDRSLSTHAARAIAAVALPVVALLASAVPSNGGPSLATGSADVRLVRLLSDVPDSMHTKPEPVHDLRVQLVAGNVLVFKKGGEFAALLPIEGTPPESLRYFYYVEKPAFLWVFAGARTKGILTVADGASLQFNSFRLRWGRSEQGLGWIYFPDDPVNEHLRFSVVSGHSVDAADPKDTKYWVDLGAEQKAGF